MKISHKRIPSGVQNSSLLQNTERVAIPKKALPEPDTTKRQTLPQTQGSSQQQLESILHETGLHSLYQQFMTFHVEVEHWMKLGDMGEVRKLCWGFREQVAGLSQQMEQGEWGEGDELGELYCEDQGDKIKELLEQIYLLRKRVAELDGSLHMDSISSLEEIQLQPTEQKSKLRSKQAVERLSMADEQQLIFNEGLANFLQLKSLTFQLLTLTWVLTDMQLPDEGAYLLHHIRESYRNDVLNCHTLCEGPQIAGMLDRLNFIVAIVKGLVGKIQRQTGLHNEDKNGEDSEFF